LIVSQAGDALSLDDEKVSANDERLATAARADVRAFSPLYARYAVPIYRYCAVRLPSREAAEDATSEIFLRALAGLGSYRGGRFVAWLFQIARSVVADTYRRTRRQLPEEAALAIVDPRPEPGEALARRAQAADLRAAIAALPTDERAVIELQLAGWTGEQMAMALGRSIPAIKMLRYRALGRLRRHLTADAEKEGMDA